MTMGPAERTEGEIGERAPWGQPGGWDPRGWLDPGHQLIKNETAHIDYHGERRVVGLACSFQRHHRQLEGPAPNCKEVFFCNIKEVPGLSSLA